MLLGLTNDDGIGAEGLAALVMAARSLGVRMLVAAPEKDWSGYSQAITVGRAIGVARRPGPALAEQFVVGGTPADCVRLMVTGYFDGVPDLVLAGVNHGPNLGEDFYASGTVGAARMAAGRGIPAVAISAASADWSWVTRQLLRHLPTICGWATACPGLVFNVNLPAYGGHCARWTALSRDGFREQIRIRPAASQWHAMVEFYRRPDDGGDRRLSDTAAMEGGLVSISAVPVYSGPLAGARLPGPVGDLVRLPDSNASAGSNHGPDQPVGLAASGTPS